MHTKEIKNRHNSQIPTTVFAQQVYSSPLPPPEALAKYEQIQPGLIKKIIEMTEAQGNHRRELEKRHLDAQILDVKMGQIFAFFIAAMAMIGGVYTAVQGYQWAGSFISAIGIGGIVTAFINGRQSKS